MTAELILSEWLEATQSRRTELLAYAKSPLPVDISERHADLDMAIRAEDDLGQLLSDAESFLAQYTAQAVLAMREKYSDLSAKERELMIKAEVKDIRRVVDGIDVTSRTVKSRIFAILNANRSR